MTFGISREKLTALEFFDRVHDYAEYIGVPELVIYYEPDDVAKSFGPMIGEGYKKGLSYRFIAIALFSLTMEKIKRDTPKEVKN